MEQRIVTTRTQLLIETFNKNVEIQAINRTWITISKKAMLSWAANYFRDYNYLQIDVFNHAVRLKPQILP